MNNAMTDKAIDNMDRNCPTITNYSKLIFCTQ